MMDSPKGDNLIAVFQWLISICLQEAGPEGGKIQLHFEELLKSNTAIFVV